MIPVVHWCTGGLVPRGNQKQQPGDITGWNLVRLEGPRKAQEGPGRKPSGLGGFERISSRHDPTMWVSKQGTPPVLIHVYSPLW